MLRIESLSTSFSRLAKYLILSLIFFTAPVLGQVSDTNNKREQPLFDVRSFVKEHSKTNLETLLSYIGIPTSEFYDEANSLKRRPVSTGVFPNATYENIQYQSVVLPENGAKFLGRSYIKPLEDKEKQSCEQLRSQCSGGPVTVSRLELPKETGNEARAAFKCSFKLPSLVEMKQKLVAPEKVTLVCKKMLDAAFLQTLAVVKHMDDLCNLPNAASPLNMDCWGRIAFKKTQSQEMIKAYNKAIDKIKDSQKNFSGLNQTLNAYAQEKKLKERFLGLPLYVSDCEPAEEINELGGIQGDAISRIPIDKRTPEEARFASELGSYRANGNYYHVYDHSNLRVQASKTVGVDDPDVINARFLGLNKENNYSCWTRAVDISSEAQTLLGQSLQQGLREKLRANERPANDLQSLLKEAQWKIQQYSGSQ